jgi:hypothetical protein
MQGQTPTLAAFKHLAETEKKLRQNWKKRWENRSALSKLFRLPLTVLNHLFLALKRIWRAIWPVIRLIFGSFLTIFSFVGLGLLGIGGLFLLLYNNSSHQIAFIPISELTALVPYPLVIISGFLSLAVPAALLLLGGLAIIRKKNLINFTVGSILVGIWMMAGITCCALGLRYFPEVLNKVENYPLTSRAEQAINLKGIKEIEVQGGLINVFVSSATNTPTTLRGRQIDLNHVEIKQEKNKLTLIEKPLTLTKEICLDCHLQSVDLVIATTTKIKITASSGASIFDETNIVKEEISDVEADVELDE